MTAKKANKPAPKEKGAPKTNADGQEKSPASEGAGIPALEKQAEEQNAKTPKDTTDKTIATFEDLQQALLEKGIVVSGVERTYNLTLTKEGSTSTKHYSCRVDENATDKELASVYHKAINELA